MTNFAIAVISFIFLALLVVFAARQGEKWLFSLSATYILASNITVQIPVEVLPGITISWAIIIYSLIYMITDIIIEYYGRRTAFGLAVLNLLVQLTLWIYVWLSLKVVPSDAGKPTYEMAGRLFGTTTQITWAAVMASVGPFLDIFITHKFRVWLQTALKRVTGSEMINFLGRTKLSTILGEIVNTVIFFSIALYGTGTTTRALTSIILTASVAKIVIALLDIPFLVVVKKFFQPKDLAIQA